MIFLKNAKYVSVPRDVFWTHSFLLLIICFVIRSYRIHALYTVYLLTQYASSVSIHFVHSSFIHEHEDDIDPNIKCVLCIQ